MLYPEASRLLGERDDGPATASDMDEVRRLVGELAATDVDERGRLQEILYALYALLESHFWRRDALYLRLVSARPQERVRALLEQVGRYARRRRFTRRSTAPVGR